MASDQIRNDMATAAFSYVKDTAIFGIGSGAIINLLIERLADIKYDIEGIVTSSQATSDQLKKSGLPRVQLNAVGDIDLFITEAEEINTHKQMIRSIGTFTQEKIIASASKTFVCLTEAAKLSSLLGEQPFPIEVLPMARSFVSREIVKLGGQPIWRENYNTENGNQIIDVHNLEMLEPLKLEKTISTIAGVLCMGIFASRTPDNVLLGKPNGVEIL